MENKIIFSNLIIDRKKELGSGYISKVYLGTDRISKQKYAIKIVRIKRLI